MKSYFLVLFILLVAIIGPKQAFSATVNVPSSTDAGRMGREQENKLPEPPQKIAPISGAPAPGIKAPEAAKNMQFTLKNIKIEGATAFGPEQLEKIYKQYIGQKISLDTVWKIADEITKLYQDKGYFISRAYIPAQNFGDGEPVKIRVVEGYAGTVVFEDAVADNYIVKDIIDKIKEEKPLNVKTLESSILRLNDIHGAMFHVVIEALKDNSSEGAVKLILIKEKQKISGSVSIDNYNSKFIGPFEDTISLKGSPAFQHETSFTFLNAMPWNRERYASFNHNITITQLISADIYGGYVKSFPGYTLATNKIESSSDNMGASLNFRVIRQRQENLTLKAKFEGKNVTTDILYTPLTRDHIRVLRLSADYDRSDLFNGYNFFNVTASHGLPVFYASERTDSNLSRSGVDPKFKKIELSANRFQTIGDWTGVTSTLMQFSKGPLYSSEQIGFGGQAFGRAYDSSEVVGDKGVLGSVELRYNGLPPYKSINMAPFIFYDLGKVWSVNDVSSFRNSTGGGIRFDTASGFFGNFTLAQPLSHAITTPDYGNGKNLHALVEAGLRF